MEYPNWFKSYAEPNFKEYLTKKDGMHVLQLGVYTGDASLWMLENLGDIRLTDVDTWKGSDEELHKTMDFEDVYDTYLSKIKDYQVDIRRSTTIHYLIMQHGAGKVFDFIYVDADHTTIGVLMDAELSWPLLKAGGIMAFDDYTWGQELTPDLTPTLGIDLFLARHEGEYEVLVINAQVWIKKNDN